MLQSLEVISVNIWQILISLANLLILFLVFKKFLYKPVKKVLDQRDAEIDARYSQADADREQARRSREQWQEKLKGAQSEADAIVSSAVHRAQVRGDKLVEKAQEKADQIVHDAENLARLEMKKAEDSMKREIVSVATTLAEKMIEREIDPEDHRDIISSCIDTVGGADE